MNAANDKMDPLDLTRVLRVLGLAAALAFADPAQSQECSGGNGGGTDATGNQCSDPVAIAERGAGHSAAALVSAPKSEQALPSNRVGAGAGTPTVNAVRTPDPSNSPGAAAHRKRARFNDGGHHVARSAVATAP